MSLFERILRWLKRLSDGPAPAPPAPPSPTSPPDSLNAIRNQLLALHNAERAKAGRPSLRRHAALDSSSQTHATWMAAHDNMTHAGDGTFDQRIRAAGYVWSFIEENIAEGYLVPESVFNGWMSDVGHRANVLGDVVDVGFGMAIGASGPYWCADYGRPA